MKTKETKRKEAQERKEITKTIPATARIANLDRNGFTAKWERNKLAHLIITESEGKITKAEIVIPGEGNQRKKAYQKPKRS